MNGKRPTAPINLPDWERFAELAREAFAAGRLTNNGVLVRELEKRLAERLQVQYLLLTSSGTLALQIAYEALGLSGEVITTPFSWVTTASSLHWMRLKPRFVDIESQSYNIDPNLISPAVTAETSAVLAVHTFGNPSKIEAIERIAASHGLLTIYDAAHAFGVTYRGRSIFDYGDAAILSLHATKIFHTVEGGAVILRNEEHYLRARLAANNGLGPDGRIAALGINGRMSELHAAVGLAMLDDIDQIMQHRKLMARLLTELLRKSSAVELQCFNVAADVNYAYFAVVFPSREMRVSAIEELTAAGFTPRVYFERPLNTLPFLLDRSSTPIAESLSRRILCLPLRADSTVKDLHAMAQIIASVCPLRDACAGRGVSV